MRDKNIQASLQRPIESGDGLSALWDKKQLARYLKVSVFTVDQWVSGRRPGPPYVKIGALVRFRPDDVHAYVAARVVSSSGATLREVRS